MSHCKPCEICPITNVCIQAVTPKPCPLDEYEDNTPKSKTETKESK